MVGEPQEAGWRRIMRPPKPGERRAPTPVKSPEQRGVLDDDGPSLPRVSDDHCRHNVRNIGPAKVPSDPAPQTGLYIEAWRPSRRRDVVARRVSLTPSGHTRRLDAGEVTEFTPDVSGGGPPADRDS